MAVQSKYSPSGGRACSCNLTAPHVRGSLRLYGLFISQVGRGGYEARVRKLTEDADFIFAKMIDTMLEVRAAVFGSDNSLHKILLQVVQHDPVCRRFMTLPGMEPVVALAFKVGVALRSESHFLRHAFSGAIVGPSRRLASRWIEAGSRRTSSPCWDRAS